MHPVRRSAALTLLLLLAVTFGPLLCRIGGDQAWLAGRAATAATTWRTGDTAPATPAAAAAPSTPAASATTAAPAASVTPAATPDATLGNPAPPPAAHAPKRCSDRHAPGPEESAPLPAPHRGEPLAPATTGPGPLAVDLPVQCALARPPTDSASVIDDTELLPVLRI